MFFRTEDKSQSSSAMHVYKLCFSVVRKPLLFVLLATSHQYPPIYYFEKNSNRWISDLIMFYTCSLVSIIWRTLICVVNKQSWNWKILDHWGTCTSINTSLRGKCARLVVLCDNPAWWQLHNWKNMHSDLHTIFCNCNYVIHHSITIIMI